jgi:hypothetical protein
MGKQNFMLNQKWISRGTIALIAFEFGLALAYLAMIVRWGKAKPLLDLNGLRSLPSLLQAAHLFAIGGLCLLLLIHRQRMVRPCSRFLPLALATLCFFGGLDELTKLHLTLNQVDWKLIYLGLLAAIPILGWRDLIWLWREHRGTMGWIAVGLGIFLLGGFGAEWGKAAIASNLTAHASPRLVFLSEHLRITVEEFAELLGETVILSTFATFTQRLIPPPLLRQP